MSDDRNPGLTEVSKSPMSQLVKADFSFQTARDIGKAFSRTPYSESHLVTHLSNVLKIFDSEVRWAKGPIGSMFNWLMRRDLENVELDGLVVLQACELAGQPALDNVKPGSRYKIPALVVRCLLEAIADRKP